jgi:hypothetical protein
MRGGSGWEESIPAFERSVEFGLRPFQLLLAPEQSEATSQPEN